MKLKLTLFAVGTLAGAASIYWLWPRYVTKVETRTQTVVRNDVRTVTRTIERPDGSREVIKETVDKSVKQESKSILAIVAKPRYNFGITAGSRADNWQPVYGVQASMRVLGPVFAGIYGRADGEFGVILQIEL